MKYKIKINMSSLSTSPVCDATIIGLPESKELLAFLTSVTDAEEQDVTIYFRHLRLTTKWNDATEGRETVPEFDEFYGGCGEGRSFNNWQDAILASLYDEYQVNDEMKEGDEFEVSYLGDTATYQCQGVHVIRV